MRLICAVLCILLAGLGFSQTPGRAITDVLQTLKDKELLPKLPQIPATQPQVNDPTIRAGQLPPGLPDPDRQELKVDKGDMPSWLRDDPSAIDKAGPDPIDLRFDVDQGGLHRVG